MSGKSGARDERTMPFLDLGPKEEDAIRQFSEITNCDEAFSRLTLQDADYDLQSALTKYFSGQDAEAHEGTAAVLAEVGESSGSISSIAARIRPHESRHVDKRLFDKVGSSSDRRSYGIIVRQEAQYSVIWSKEHGLICAAGLGRRQNRLGNWVSFKCFEDFDLRIESGQLKKSAYEVADIPPKRVSYSGGTVVKCQALVRIMLHSRNEVFQMVEDAVFGVILCSFDNYLMRMLHRVDDDEDVEVLIVYLEDYQRPSNWFAVGVNRGNDDWRKLEKLPTCVDELATKAFLEIRHTEEDGTTLTNNMIQKISKEGQFDPPSDWKGFIQVTEERINDVLGIVICHEANNAVSVIFTIFGLARFPSFLELGTWLRMSINEDSDGAAFPNVSAVTSRNYHIRQSSVIPPPMSTRVITVDGNDRLLLCGIITYIGPRCYENVYLGKIFDKKNKIVLNSEAPPHSKGFLAEFSIFSKNNHWYWNILQCHGTASGDVNSVPLEMSVFPHYLGRVYKDPSSSGDRKAAV